MLINIPIIPNSALMSLTYFEDAEEQFMPEMLVAIDWDRIKSFIIDKVATLSL